MTPLPVDSTARLVAHYTWRGQGSRVQYRFESGVSMATAVSALDAFHSAIYTHMFNNWAALSAAEFYPGGSTISVPVALEPISAGTGGADTDVLPDAFQLEFLGRSADGRRASWYFQGAFVGMPTNQRVTLAAYPAVDAIHGGLVGLVAANLVTISGEAPILKSYANCVVNDYLTRRARRGG